MTPLLTIKGLHIAVDSSADSGQAVEVVRGIDLTIEKGEVHAIMGPNGSGKSTLVNTLMGHPKYSITKGEVRFQGKDLLAMKPHERAIAGLFLAFQYPKEIAGVTLRSFLSAAWNAQIPVRHPEQKKLSPIKFRKLLEEKMKTLHLDAGFAERHVNKGFSGGEKKKAEVLQMSVLEPTLALLDETDSGLDIDALKIVAEGIQAMRSKERSFLVVTHYARILDYLTPDHVHVMVRGKIVESGGAALAKKLEAQGYEKYAIV